MLHLLCLLRFLRLKGVKSPLKLFIFSQHSYSLNEFIKTNFSEWFFIRETLRTKY